MNLNTSRHTARARSWATLTLAAMLATTAPMAQATLNPYSSGGVNLVQLQNGPLNLAMTADGNLLGSFLDGVGGAANKRAFKDSIIAASGGSIGTRTLVRGDFNNDGRTTYFGALALINYLNSTSYGGTNQWRLPGVTDTGPAGCSGTECGHNVDPASSDLARLYYSELGRIAKFDTDGFSNSGNDYGIFANDGLQTPSGAIGPFSNVESSSYWLGSEYSPIPQTAWAFATSDGYQGFESKEGFGYAWAVTSGPVSPVPLPAPLWLIGSGLLCLAGKLRGKRPA